VEIKSLKKSKILEDVRRLAHKRREEVYLVGGAVRDLFLGRPLGKDFDFAVLGDVENLVKEVAREIGGHAFSLDETFGTWRVVLKKKRKKTELDFSAMQGKDIFEDLRQRDFTVNSIAIHLKDLVRLGEACLIDPLNGLGDLRRRILRASSEESLRRDPLRMLRAFRFASTLKFFVEDETLKMIRRNHELIKRSAGERVRAEFFAGLGEKESSRFLRHLRRAGLLEEIFPELGGWEKLYLGEEYSLLDHGLRTVEAAEFILSHLQDLFPHEAVFLRNHFSQTEEEGVTRTALFKFTAFFHDSGKMVVAPLGQGGPAAGFPDHDQEGEKINTAVAQRLKLSRRSIRIISDLTRQHMRVSSLARTPGVTARAKYRFFQDMGREGIDLAILSLANALASSFIQFRWPLLPVMNEELNKIKCITEALLRYYQEEFVRKPAQPLLDGKEVMEGLGIPRGKKVGILLQKLQEAEASGQVRTKEEALQFLKNIDKFL
jgi:poly(A) polymerase